MPAYVNHHTDVARAVPPRFGAGEFRNAPSLLRSGHPRMRLRRRLRELARVVRARRAKTGLAGSAPAAVAGAHEINEHDLDRMGDPSLAAVWIGHGTVLAHVGGQWVLVDPVFSERSGVRPFDWLKWPNFLQKLIIGPKRLMPPMIDLHELPEIDLVLLTHAHFDHFDVHSLGVLASPRTSVVTARGTAGLVPRGFASVHEIDWDQHAQVAGLRILALKPRHWGSRILIDRGRGYNAYAVTGTEPSGTQRSVLFGGDSAHTRAFDRLGDRVPNLELAVLGIGAYEPWLDQHASPEQAWDMFRTSGARRLMPVHHSTFVLSNEPLDEPLARLNSVAQAAGERDRIVGERPGEVWTLET